MPDIKDFHEQLDRIKVEWDKAERCIKIAEQISLQVVFPSIKELRYAGRRIVDALHLSTAENSDEIRALLDDALFDCLRARHDAIDVAVSTISAEMDITAKKLGYTAILTAFPDFPELLSQLRLAKEKVTDSRGERNTRDEVYGAIEAVNLPSLVSLYRDFKGSEKVMRGIAKQERFWPLTGVVLSIVAIIVTIVVGYLSIG